MFRPAPQQSLHVLGFVISIIISATAMAQVQDAFDGGRTRWRLEIPRNRAQVVRQEIDLQGGRFGTPAERIDFFVSESGRMPIFYPLSPTTILADFQL